MNRIPELPHTHRPRWPQNDFHWAYSTTQLDSFSAAEDNWSGSPTPLPTGPHDMNTNNNASPNASPNPTNANSNGITNSLTDASPSSAGTSSTTVITFTTSIPVTTVVNNSTTVTSFSQSVWTTTTVFPASSALPSLSLPASTSASPFGVSGPGPSGLPRGSIATQSQPVCIGRGLDAYSQGLLAAVIVPSVIGLVIWAAFAVLRPRFRQIYGLREWFVEPEIRPKPLGSSFFAFLFPHVPLVPSLPSSSPDIHRGAADDRNPSPSPSTNPANVFPSDEALAQRLLWVCLMIVLGWTVLGLAGALPLYLVRMPCLADASGSSQSTFGGAYSALQDLSLLRLLRLLDEGQVTTASNLSTRMVVNGQDYAPEARTRLIILVALTLVVALLPALYKILKEFNKLMVYRRLWINDRCEGVEMGWLSARKAPGLVGWGEKRIKDFFVKSGLSAGSEAGGRHGIRAEIRRQHGSIIENGHESGSGSSNASRNGLDPYAERRRRNEERPLTTMEEGELEVDIQSLFSISDTQQLALLIMERDAILENLEIAETQYISSFTLTTPDPSIADFEPPTAPRVDVRPYISRPLPLGGPARKEKTRRGRRAINPALAATSLAPTSFVGPSQYYKLRGVHGISGGRFGGSEYSYPRSEDDPPSLSQSINSRVIGSRFQEVNRNSAAYGRLPMGSYVGVSEKGELGGGVSGRNSGWANSDRGAGTMSVGSGNIAGIGGGMGVGGMGGMLDRLHTMERGSRLDMFTIEEAETPIPDPRRYGPNHSGYSDENGQGVLNDGEEWVDLNEYVDYQEMEEAGANPGQSSTSPLPLPRRRPKKEPVSASRRETFPLRHKSIKDAGEDDMDEVPPPHLRLQPQQPFVRPLSGLDFDGLGSVYEDIRHWRSRLKAINVEINDAQTDLYHDIAEGVRVKGWLLIGRGLRYLPGIELIEGRAKEDVRWDVLQNEREGLDHVVWWAVMIFVGVILAAGLTAASGLALAIAPDVAHYLPFLVPLLSTNSLAAGIATVLAPAVAASVFVMLALWAVRWAVNIRQPASVSGGQLLAFKSTFYILTAVASLWLITVGSLLFSFQSFSQDGSSNSDRSRSVANGSIYMSVLALAIVMNVAIIFPGLLMLQPIRLWQVRKAEKLSITPRQRFRAVYPRTYDPSYAIAACVLAIVFACTFSMIFPLIGPAVVLLLLLTLIAHRYLVGYVYGRTHSQTGGLLHLWMLRRFGSLLSFQPFLLGLILLSRRQWILGGVCCVVGVVVLAFVETYTSWKMRLPARSSLKPITRDSLDHFEEVIKMLQLPINDEEGVSLVGSARSPQGRGSMASVLEMMSLTLAVMPSPTATRGPVPLDTETLDDLTATERAARTHPDAPPRLPPLPFTDYAEEMAGILYAPELIARPPIIWLPNDSAGVARSEAVDLQKYHDLRVTLDVRAKGDVLPRRSTSSRD